MFFSYVLQFTCYIHLGNERRRTQCLGYCLTLRNDWKREFKELSELNDIIYSMLKGSTEERCGKTDSENSLLSSWKTQIQCDFIININQHYHPCFHPGQKLITGLLYVQASVLFVEHICHSKSSLKRAILVAVPASVMMILAMVY